MLIELVVELTDRKKLLVFKLALVLLELPETGLLNLTLIVCLTVLLEVVVG